MRNFISVSEARALIEMHCCRMESVSMDLIDAGGKVLDTAVIAPLDIPAYPQSSMDGYAFLFEPERKNYKLVGEMAAGSSTKLELKAGEAVRIFTGAPVPLGTNTVLMQEKAKVEKGLLWVEDSTLIEGANVRPVGSEMQKGQIALAPGTLLTPAAIGLLANLGIAAVQVVPSPRISIIVTGNELVQPGLPLGYGEVYEANSFALSAALRQAGSTVVSIRQGKDQINELTDLLHDALNQSDMVLLTGGVSVGAYDFTEKIFNACGVEKIFHKIRQRPGKPMLFGMLGHKPVFGLPGNPASVLTCFYQYVLPAISKMCGMNKCLPMHRAKLKKSYTKPEGITHFLKAYYDGEQVEWLSGQESYKLNSFAQANCLAEIPEGYTLLQSGDWVHVYLFE